MKLLKRWTSTITSSFDWAISQIENHEQLVETALQDMQSAAAKARVQLSRVQQDGKRLGVKIKEHENDVVLWSERAQKLAENDQGKALECLRRKKRASALAASLTEQRAEHKDIERRLEADYRKIIEQIDVLKRKKNSFAARQARSSALQKGLTDDISVVSAIDDIFDRWEVKIADVESLREPLDSLEEELETAEELEALQAELAALRTNLSDN